MYANTGSGKDLYDLGYDTHLMVGVETASGELIAAGQGFEGSEIPQGSLNPRDMTVVKASASGSVLWTWKSGFTGDDVVAAVVSFDAASIIVGGFRTVDGRAKRTLVRLRLDTTLPSGTSRVIWTATFDEVSGHSSFSTLALTADGDLLLGGFLNKANAEEMQFHSSGVVPSGTAFVSQVSALAIARSSGPSRSDESGSGWIWLSTSWITAVTVQPSLGRGVTALLHGEVQGKSLAGVVILDSTGAQSVAVQTYPNQLQATAMAASPTGGYLIAGVGNVASSGPPSYKGRVSRINETGTLLWDLSLNPDGVDSTAIYTECWGVQPSAGICSRGLPTAYYLLPTTYSLIPWSRPRISVVWSSTIVYGLACMASAPAQHLFVLAVRTCRVVLPLSSTNPAHRALLTELDPVLQDKRSAN